MKLDKDDLIKLKKDITTHINIINFAEDYELTDIQWLDHAYIMTGKSDYEWTYIGSIGEIDSDAIMKALEGHHRIMLQDPVLLKAIGSRYPIEWILSCSKLVYQGPILEGDYDVIPLKAHHAAYIQAHNDYGDFTDVDYIKTRIDKGIGFGIESEGKLVAWVLTHDDGAIGFIKVLEAYRNQGYAKLLTDAVIQALQTKGKLPFVHIESQNIKSLNLAKKSGFEYVGEVHWLKIKEE